MTKAEQGPRIYSFQDHLKISEDFKYNVSTDPDEIAKRHEEAGTGKNISDDESAGLLVAHDVLAELSLEEQIIWAQIVAGTELNAALYLLKRIDPTMYRNVRLVEKDAQPISAEAFRARAISHLGDAAKRSARFAQTELNGTTTPHAIEVLGRNFLRGAVDLSMFGMDGEIDIKDNATAEEAKERVAVMHESVQELAREAKVNPTPAQLRSDTTELGVHIARSTKKYPPQLIAKFKDVSHRHGAPKGYS